MTIRRAFLVLALALVARSQASFGMPPAALHVGESEAVVVTDRGRDPPPPALMAETDEPPFSPALFPVLPDPTDGSGSPPPGPNFLGSQSAAVPARCSFQGFLQSTGAIPPDVAGAVGPRHLVLALNGRMRIQNRAGENLSSPLLSNF